MNYSFAVFSLLAVVLFSFSAVADVPFYQPHSILGQVFYSNGSAAPAGTPITIKLIRSDGTVDEISKVTPTNPSVPDNVFFSALTVSEFGVDVLEITVGKDSEAVTNTFVLTQDLTELNITIDNELTLLEEEPDWVGLQENAKDAPEKTDAKTSENPPKDKQEENIPRESPKEETNDEVLTGEQDSNSSKTEAINNESLQIDTATKEQPEIQRNDEENDSLNLIYIIIPALVVLLILYFYLPKKKTKKKYALSG